jgi:hypothetical protein
MIADNGRLRTGASKQSHSSTVCRSQQGSSRIALHHVQLFARSTIVKRNAEQNANRPRSCAACATPSDVSNVMTKKASCISLTKVNMGLTNGLINSYSVTAQRHLNMKIGRARIGQDATKCFVEHGAISPELFSSRFRLQSSD